MTPPREIELKLTLQPEDLAGLRRHPLLRGKRPKRLELEAIYYDTPKDKLARSGVSLRVRREGGAHIQAVKSETGGGLVDRGEWQVPIAGQALDVKALRPTPAGKLLNGAIRKLTPKVETHVDRSFWHVHVDGSTIEVTIDEGKVLAGGAARHVTEVELELKDGSAETLFGLAKTLSAHVPLRLGVESKYQQGRALLTSEPGAHKAPLLHIADDATAADALRAIVHSCLRHFRLNEPLLLEARDPAALHQCRVALRRLRSALSLFRKLIGDERSQSIRQSLKDIAGDFGAARNLDVFLAWLAKEERESPAGKILDAADFLGKVEAERTRAYDRLIAKLDSAEFRHLVIEIVAWAETGEWRRCEPARESLRSHGRRKLKKRHRSFRKGSQALASLSEGQRHRLRIKTEKLRYGCEFLAPLSDHPKRFDRYVGAISAVQETLGDLNDATTARRLAEDLVRAYGDASKSVALSAGAILATKGNEAEGQLQAAQDALDDYLRAKPFW